MKVKIADVKVGVRMRKDFGDLEGLAASIVRLGQLQPIVIDEDMNLIAGERRLRACKLLNMEEILAITKEGADDLTKKECELEENLKRKEFNWPEEVLALLELYTLKQEKYGQANPGEAGGGGGFGIKQAKEELDMSAGAISMDLTLARALYEFPHLAEEKTKSAAFKRYRRDRETKLRAEIAKRTSVHGMAAAASVPSTPAAPKPSGGKSATDMVLEQLGIGGTPSPAPEARPEEEPLQVPIRKADFGPQHGVLYCGDSRKVLKALPAGLVDCIVTDPPYALGLFKEGDNTTGKRLAENQGGLYDDDPHKVLDMLDTVFREAARVLKPKGHAYVFFHFNWYLEIYQMLEKHFGEGTVERVPCIWTKNTPGIGDPNVRWVPGYEPFFFVNRGRDLVKPQGFNYLRYDTVPPGQKTHPTEKPMQLLRHIIAASCVPGEIVLEPFMGSGSTIHAAVDLGCKFIGCELSETYYRRICDRIATEIGARADEGSGDDVSNAEGEVRGDENAGEVQ